MYSKLTIKTPKRRQWRLSGVFIVNFKRILQLVLVLLLLTLNTQLPAAEDSNTQFSCHYYKVTLRQDEKLEFL